MITGTYTPALALAVKNPTPSRAAIIWFALAVGSFSLQFAGSAACVLPPGGIVGWWSGDSTTNDELGMNPAVLLNGASYGTGKVNDAFLFEGAEAWAYIAPTPSLNLSNAISLEAWIMHTNLGASVQRYITLMPEKAQIRYDGLNGFHFSIKVGGVFYQLRPGIAPQVGSWHHVVGTYDGTRQTLYVDGALVAQQPVIGTLDPQASSGAALSSSFEPMYGEIDEAVIYSRALTAGEVQSIFLADSSGICKKPRIVQQPQSQTVFTGQDASFQVLAVGGGPMNYQWSLNGNLIVGETSQTIIIPGADFTAPTPFAVTVANTVGVVTSTNAVLTVLSASGALSSGRQHDGSLGLGFQGQLGVQCVQRSTNLLNWRPLLQITNLGRGVSFSDSDSNLSLAFYRTACGPCVTTNVDATTLHGKVLCGYDGWFRCPGDDTNIWAGWPESGTNMWIHWSGAWNQITTNTLTFDMWPDMTDYAFSERYPAPGFNHADGSQAHLFSSVNPETINRHFEWMRDYAIDGVFLERFLIDTTGRPWMTNVIKCARAAANRTGRVFAIAYDMAGADPTNIVSLITNDWKWLVESEKLTQDPRYLRHNGKPVLLVWGFYTNQLTSTSVANEVVSFFKSNSICSVTLIGGCEWWWRTDPDPAWAQVFRRFDVICPWNVGNYYFAGTNGYATTSYWPEDMSEAARAGMLYMPVLYPGFSWDNLKRLPPGTSNIPRLGGDFFWKQFYDAANLGLDMAFVGMFDEVDEGTAVFKVTSSPPTQGYFATFEGKPSDWYLRLTSEGSKMLRGQRPITRTIPISP